MDTLEVSNNFVRRKKEIGVTRGALKIRYEWFTLLIKAFFKSIKKHSAPSSFQEPQERPFDSVQRLEASVPTGEESGSISISEEPNNGKFRI